MILLGTLVLQDTPRGTPVIKHLALTGLALTVAAMATGLVAAASASTPQRALAAPVCLDATNSRADNTNVRLWSCLNHPNQKWVIRDGQIIVADTLASNPVCLDATNSRADNTNVRLWSCLNHPNQKWVIRDGQIIVADTLASNPVCLDATNSRADNTNVRLWSCLNHPNQKWVIRDGQIIVADTFA
ncbi:ricin-type beta-trefoil lectin protein [Actinomadura pelletieri DSM 43383]|uniref:Ricin-type beta-trefoil lectin protein n=1 Tax=Actinomadura pelletieri DSM 43383 TaxID=1120940 RepID=A0A495QLP1_9ACTN|nr:ricin-type beta-trefoil lectin protein [Actinomadura pelletieri DSM 43383]